jgi:hypothetical protein
MKVIEEKVFQYLLNYLISILENIHYIYEKIQNKNFHLMLLEHDQFQKPILKSKIKKGIK